MALGLSATAPWNAARAEVVMLQCGVEGRPPEMAVDIDYDRSTVSWPGGNPARTVSATISDRIISFTNPYTQWPSRIDRVTGELVQFVNGGWMPNPYGASICTRIQGRRF